MTFKQLLENKKIGSKKGLIEVPFTEEKSLKFGDKPANPVNVVIVDTETTGLNYLKNEIIELAGVGAQFCAATGRLHSVGALFDFFNQPLEPIPRKITEITGITNEDVEGHSIDYLQVNSWFRKADIILAHNASFDRPFVEQLPLDWEDIVKPWGCSCVDPDWTSLGMPNRKLEGILEHLGYEYTAHRAIYDCLATAFLLALNPEQFIRINHLCNNESYKVSFTWTPRGSNPLVKARGYAFSGTSWSKYYLDLEEMAQERQEIASEIKKAFGKLPTVVVNQAYPLSRFSPGY